jgi:hypothetical protein
MSNFNATLRLTKTPFHSVSCARYSRLPLSPAVYVSAWKSHIEYNTAECLASDDHLSLMGCSMRHRFVQRGEPLLCPPFGGSASVMARIKLTVP